MTRHHRSFAVLAFVLMLCAVSSAQTEQTRPWWITLGGGTAVADGHLTMALGGLYGQRLESSLISARIFGVTNDNPTVWRLDPSSTTYRLTDYGILYGPAWGDKDGYVSLGAGIGLVRATIETATTSSLKSVVSLPIEAQAFWQVEGSFGIGLYAFTSINSAKIFSGVIIAVQMGVMPAAR